jgi:hypothetical protein
MTWTVFEGIALAIAVSNGLWEQTLGEVSSVPPRALFETWWVVLTHRVALPQHFTGYSR